MIYSHDQRAPALARLAPPCLPPVGAVRFFEFGVAGCGSAVGAVGAEIGVGGAVDTEFGVVGTVDAEICEVETGFDSVATWSSRSGSFGISLTNTGSLNR